MVAAGYWHTVGLKSDGAVVAVGDSGSGQCNVGSWTGITQVAAGTVHTVGLKSDGTMVAVGSNSWGECNLGGLTGIIQVAAGNEYTVGLKSDGTVVAVGWNYYGQCNVSDWTDITRVAAWEYHTVGLKSDGTVVAVGRNYGGDCNVSDWTGIIQVAAGYCHTVGLKSDGTVVAVGYNNYGQCNVGSWTGIIQVAGGNFNTVGLKSDGTVVAVGDNRYGQCNVSDWTGITQVAGGGSQTVGLKSDGTVVAVGWNGYGACNVSDWNLLVTCITPTPSPSPTPTESPTPTASPTCTGTCPTSTPTVSPTPSPTATWDPDAWSYNVSGTVTANGTCGNLSNYQLRLILHYGSGTNNGSDIYLGGNCQPDFDDVRFTRSDGISLLDYWIEKVNAGVNATVWVEFDTISASGTYFYIYCGNPSASSASNGSNTLLFFDDFADNDYTSNPTWTVGSGTWSAADGYLTHSGNFEGLNISSTSISIPAGSPIMLEYDCMWTSTWCIANQVYLKNSLGSAMLGGSGTHCDYNTVHGLGMAYNGSSTAENYVSQNISTNVWHHFKVFFNGTSYGLNYDYGTNGFTIASPAYVNDITKISYRRLAT